LLVAGGAAEVHSEGPLALPRLRTGVGGSADCVRTSRKRRWWPEAETERPIIADEPLVLRPRL